MNKILKFILNLFKRKPKPEPKAEPTHKFELRDKVVGTNMAGRQIEGNINMRGWCGRDDYYVVSVPSRGVLTKCLGKDLVKLTEETHE